MIGREEIMAMFGPQLDLIGDDDIKEKVIKVWIRGCSRGGWETVEQLKDVPFTLLTDTHGIDFIEHTVAVTEGALGLAISQMETYSELPYTIDMDRLVAGGLLHDVGKLMEIEPDGEGGYRKSRSGMLERHPISGAILAAEVGLPDDYVNTISCHSKEGDGRPQVIETVFVHQADFATFNPVVMKNRGLLVE